MGCQSNRHSVYSVKRRTGIFLTIAVFSTLICLTELRAAARKAPYLIYENDVSEITILWQLNTTASCVIEWGDDQTYSLGSAITNEYGGNHQHKYVLTGLQPGQLYYYRVFAAGRIYTGSFHCAPQSNSDHVKFMVYGDSRTFPAIHDQVAAEMLATYVEDPEFQTITLSVGDLVTNGDDENTWDSEHFNANYSNIHELLAETPYLTAIGNHDGSGTLFARYFPYPYEDGRYWSYDYGPVHFTVVDQYTDYSPGSTQLAWIEDDLASTNRPWKVVYLHEPGWSAGNHANDSTVQNYIQPLCVQYGVSLVFAGHNHYYARAVVDGIQHITTGGGGAPLQSPDPGYPHVVAASMNYHFCRIEINDHILHFEAVKPDGTIIDSFTMENSMTVPSLSEWGMIIMILFVLALGSAGILYRRRRTYNPESGRLE